MRVVQPVGEKGSLKWMQRAIAEQWSDLHEPLLAGLKGARAIEWLSPLGQDDYAEYRDADFLRRLDLHHLVPALEAFWPKRGPQWDGFGRSDAGHVILVEAKAHIAELCSPPSQASADSLAKINDALQHTALSLGVSADRMSGWQVHFYQYANRLAHLLWLREHKVDAKLALIGFVEDAEMPGRTTVEAWQAAYLVADKVLGLGARHPLSSHVLHLYPDVRNH